jgi:hypothetical protein
MRDNYALCCASLLFITGLAVIGWGIQLNIQAKYNLDNQLQSHDYLIESSQLSSVNYTSVEYWRAFDTNENRVININNGTLECPYLDTRCITDIYNTLSQNKTVYYTNINNNVHFSYDKPPTPYVHILAYFLGASWAFIMPFLFFKKPICKQPNVIYNYLRNVTKTHRKAPVKQDNYGTINKKLKSPLPKLQRKQSIGLSKLDIILESPNEYSSPSRSEQKGQCNLASPSVQSYQYKLESPSGQQSQYSLASPSRVQCPPPSPSGQQTEYNLDSPSLNKKINTIEMQQL